MKKALYSPHPRVLLPWDSEELDMGAAELARGHWAEAAHLSSASLAQLDRGPLPEPTSWMARRVLGCPDYQPVGVPGTPSSGRAEIKSVLFITPGT